MDRRPGSDRHRRTARTRRPAWSRNHLMLRRGRTATARAALVVVVVGASCGSGDDGSGVAPDWVAAIPRALDAVESQLGEGQEYFEITANPQLTNVFVAVDDGTAAVPYVYQDGMLLDPAPRLEGASGRTFTAEAIGFDEAVVLDGIRRELPDVTIDAFSVEGGPAGSVRYVVAARSAQGGVLDIEVGPNGEIVAVDPI